MANVEETVSFAEAIRQALAESLEGDNRTIVFGLGVPDPKGVFGTTLGLQERFGVQRVFDMPCSENAMMGVALGLALGGFRPVMVHQRLDFFLLAMDQLVTQAAKWRFMFGDEIEVPLVVRLVVGRGWGQGPQHSQCLHSWLMHVPGLKVAMPASARDAKGMLLAAISDPNPVVFIEHRWLHHSQGALSALDDVEGARVAREGSDITVLAISSAVVEALTVAEALAQSEKADVEVIDARWARPLDVDTINRSVAKTGRLLVLDCSWPSAGFASEAIAIVNETCWDKLKMAPRRLCYLDTPSPTSCSLAADFYYQAHDVELAVREILGMSHECLIPKETDPMKLDIPHAGFKGPF